MGPKEELRQNVGSEKGQDAFVFTVNGILGAANVLQAFVLSIKLELGM
jgi:hypothetical protein